MGHAYLLAVRWGHHPEQHHSEKMASVLLDIRSNLNAAALRKEWKECWGFQQRDDVSLGPRGNFDSVGVSTCIL